MGMNDKATYNLGSTTAFTAYLDDIFETNHKIITFK